MSCVGGSGARDRRRLKAVAVPPVELLLTDAELEHALAIYWPQDGVSVRAFRELKAWREWARTHNAKRGGIEAMSRSGSLDAAVNRHHRQMAVDALTIACADLGADELRVLSAIAARLAEGRRTYGELDLATDKRDFSAEARDEVFDALVYVACRLIRGDG